MAHRGRLNVLAHVVGNQTPGHPARVRGACTAKGPLNVPGTGDVKYHHGAEGEYKLADGGSIHVTLVPNPSHLEYVNPVVIGMTRSMQYGDEERREAGHGRGRARADPRRRRLRGPGRGRRDAQPRAARTATRSAARSTSS